MIALRQPVEIVSLEEWLSFDRLHPAPTFFARPAWALALAYAYPHLRPHPVRIHLGSVSLLLPLVQSSGGRLGWREFVGMPLGGYTCALRQDGSLATTAEFVRGLQELSRVCDALTVLPWPLASWKKPVAWHGPQYETAVIDLSGGAEQAIRHFDGVSRRMAGQALRRGVTCEPCVTALGSTTYYGMLREAAERWNVGKPTFPKELLDALIAYGGKDVEVWLARCDGHPIAGGVVLYGSQELFFWSAALRHAYARLRPSNALNVALIRAAAERGMRWYNLGASEGLPGVERFKRGLGATNVAYHELHRDRFAFALYSRLRQSLRRSRASAGSAYAAYSPEGD